MLRVYSYRIQQYFIGEANIQMVQGGSSLGNLIALLSRNPWGIGGVAAVKTVLEAIGIIRAWDRKVRTDWRMRLRDGLTGGLFRL